jgi:hypothetical protein
MAKRKPSCPLNLDVIKSKHGPTYKVRISGCVGKIAVSGETTPVYVGLDRIDYALANKITRVNRASGSGKPIPVATQIKIKKAVLKKLQDLEQDT